MTLHTKQGDADEKKLVVIAILVATSLVIAIISVFSFYNDRVLTNARIAEIDRRLNSIGHTTAWGVSNWLIGQVNLTDAGLHAIQRLDASEDPYSVLSQPVMADRFFHAMYGDADGRFSISPPRLVQKDYDPRERPWYQAAVQTGDVIATEPYASVSTGQLILTIARPNIQDNEIRGVVGNDILVDDIIQLLSQDTEGFEAVFVADQAGQILVHEDKRQIGRNLSEIFDGVSLELSRDSQVLLANGKEKIVQFVSIANPFSVNWQIGMIMDKETVYADINAFRRSIVIANIAATALMVIAIGLVTQFFLVRPLMSARRVAEQADRAKSEFLASMSHEIRTPMNGILGMAEILKSTPLNEKQTSFVDTIYRSGEALTTILNDILDFSKIESGKMELDSAPFDMRGVIEDCAALFGGTAREKGIELIIRVAPDLPSALVGDAGRMRQAITNLVGNAIKFTHDGYVLVDLQCVATKTTAKMKVCVRDTGIGIPEDKVATIFEEFTQAEGSITRKYGGTGLGLSITRSLIKAMGGEIGVTSDYGSGSDFWFEIDLPVSESDCVVSMTKDVDLSNARILIVDDLQVNRQILEEQLGAWGARTGSASDATEAISMLLEAHNASKPYGIAIIDYHMPDTDGAQLVEKIRQRSEIAETLFVVLSSVDSRDLVKRFRDLGVSEFHTKPARSTTLQASIQNILSTGQRMQTKRQPSDALDAVCQTENAIENAEAKPRILIAEDNNVNRAVLENMIDESSYTLSFAVDGREAFTACKREQFDLILMDISMPEMDGIESLKAIRSFETKTGRTATPIIAITAHALHEDRDRFNQLGFDDYLAKPINQKGVTRIVHAWVGSTDDQEVSGDKS